MSRLDDLYRLTLATYESDPSALFPITPDTQAWYDGAEACLTRWDEAMLLHVGKDGAGLEAVAERLAAETGYPQKGLPMFEWSCFFVLFGLAWLCWQLSRLPPPRRRVRLVLTPVLPQVAPDVYIDAHMPIAEQKTVALALQNARCRGCPPGVSHAYFHETIEGELRCLAMLGVN
jgi:hypothetical protein